MPAPLTLRINRAPVLRLWAAVVAERLGMPHEAALTVGQSIPDVHLRGKLVHVAETPAGRRASAMGELVNPEAVERYLRGSSAMRLILRAEMDQLAAGFPPERLNHEGFHLYEQFRPKVPPDERGWGAKGVLDVAKIHALRPR